MLMENFLQLKKYWQLVDKGLLTTAEGTQPKEVENNVIEKQRLKNLKWRTNFSKP